MSTPRDGGPGDAEDRPEDQRGRSELPHLGGSGGDAPADRPAGDDAPDRPWEPPGWSLPSAEPDRPQQPDQQQPPQERRRGGLLGGLFGGGGRGPAAPEPGGDREPWGHEQQWGQANEPVLDPTDRFGTRSWAAAMGWTATDGSGPEDAAVTQLVQTAPIRPGKQDVPGNVLRGRADGLDLVAFDVLTPVGRGWGITHAVTAAPLLGAVPDFRLTPARFWRHGTGGLLQIPSGDPEFDQRYVLLTTADGPEVRRVADDPVVRQALLGSDDGDEIWSAVGFVAAVRPDGHRPLLIQHHAQLLAAVSAALAAG